MKLSRIFPGRQEFRNGIFLALVLALVMVASAIAGNMHFTGGGGSWSSPVHITADVAGLGNEVAFVDATLIGSIRAICTNKGGTSAPGRNYISASVSVSAGPFPSDSNGHAHIEFSAPVPTTASFKRSPSPKEAGCPSGNWTVTGVLPNTEDWDTLTLFAKAVVGGPALDTLLLT